MKIRVRWRWALAVALGILGPVHAESTLNTVVVVIANGPLAGTYRPDPQKVACLRTPSQHGVSLGFKDFDAHDAKQLAEGGMEVTNADRPTGNHGNVLLTFGDPDKVHTTYRIPDGPMKLDKKGRGFTITFDGKTESKIKITMTATCTDVTDV